MNNRYKFRIVTLLTAVILIPSCEENDVLPIDYYSCNFSFQDTSATHPKAGAYQNILGENRKNGIVGATLLIKDRDGLWIGADGKADIYSNIDMRPCNTFLIASISKVFTSAAVYRYIDKGVLSIDDPISKWLSKFVVENVKNADQTQIQHLLAHTSGIADFYTFQFELDRINRISNDWNKEEVLKYIYGASPTNGVGEAYSYSNTNFLLLSMILERASGLSFEEVYQQEVFNPLGLRSAYYSEEQPLPSGSVKGYVDIYGNNQFVESEFLYNDELGIGGDGGIAINVYDLAVFFEQMMKGSLISTSSLVKMTDWFSISEEWVISEGPYGQSENGFGIEQFTTQYGYAVGHTGGIDGFSSIAMYFPNEDMTCVLLLNSAGNEAGSKSQEKILEEVIEKMFE